MASVATMAVGAVGSAKAQTVATPGGTFPPATYQGVAGNGITAFLGLRYAAAPTGPLRFAPPAPPAFVPGTISATRFGSACPQNASASEAESTNEDCLSLDVYVPASSVSPTADLPVMVFLHGGGFVQGQGSAFDNRSTPMDLAIQGNTIVVTLNYRLGILGSLSDARLSALSATGASGNYGLMDQQFALKWVRQNIGAFGGNANNVTIFGQSGGAVSTCSHIVSPTAAGLFHRAIIESGPCSTPLSTRAPAQAAGASIVAKLGCDNATAAQTVTCLRALSVPQILAAQGTITAANTFGSLLAFTPIVDGVLIPKEPILALVLGQFNRVPVIQGTNHDEGRLFVAGAFDLNANVGPLTAAGYPAAVQSLVQGVLGGATGTNQTRLERMTQEVLTEYPLSHFAGPDEALAAVLTDSAFSCQAYISDALFSLYVPTFAYEFSDENAPTPFAPQVSFPYGAAHTDELPFLFTVNGVTLSSSEQTLAATMKSYWTNFAKNANPNTFTAPFWPRYTVLDPAVQSLVPPNPSAEINFAPQHKCGFWLRLMRKTILESVADHLTPIGR
jgi:para-nitrobenzyl esterase